MRGVEGVEWSCVMGRYFTGAGVDTDTKKAMELWESAAEKGDTEAVYLLGLCYTGIGAGEGGNVRFATHAHRRPAEWAHTVPVLCLVRVPASQRGRTVSSLFKIALTFLTSGSA